MAALSAIRHHVAMTDVVPNRVQWNRYGRQPGQPLIRTNLQQYLETVPSDTRQRMTMMRADCFNGMLSCKLLRIRTN